MKNPDEPLWWVSDAKHPNRKKHRAPVGVIVAFLLIVGVMVTALVASPDPLAPRSGPYGATIHQAKALETVGQCGGVFEFDVPEQFSGQIPAQFFEDDLKDKSIPTHPMIVPAYGYFNSMRDEPIYTFIAPDAVADVPPSYEYMDYLWNGWTIIWYNPTEVDEDALISIQSYVSSNKKVAAYPWDAEYHGNNLPLDRRIGYSSWGATMSCGLWDGEIADNFQSFTAQKNAGRDPKKPHVAPLDANNELYPIAIPAWS